MSTPELLRAKLIRMRWFGLSASISVMLSSGCTAPNPAFDLEVRADSGDASKGSSVSDGSTDSDSTGSHGDGDDSKGDDGHDDDGHDDDGHDDDDSDSDSGDDDDPQGCRVTDCDDDEYCAFPEGAFCAFEVDIRGTCEPRPETCLGLGDPVHGCDCNVYENPCEAQQAGVDVLCRVGDDFCLC